MNVITRSSINVITYLSESKADNATSLRVFAVFGQKSGIAWAFYIKQYQRLTKSQKAVGGVWAGFVQRYQWFAQKVGHLPTFKSPLYCICNDTHVMTRNHSHTTPRLF
jgi:hypothetical protein